MDWLIYATAVFAMGFLGTIVAFSIVVGLLWCLAGGTLRLCSKVPWLDEELCAGVFVLLLAATGVGILCVWVVS